MLIGAAATGPKESFWYLQRDPKLTKAPIFLAYYLAIEVDTVHPPFARVAVILAAGRPGVPLWPLLNWEGAEELN